jgi:hypothetical protein
MALLARRNVFHDRIRSAVTLTGIVFALYAAIMDHIREYATLKAMGATNGYLYRGLPLGLRVDSYVQTGIQGH